LPQDIQLNLTEVIKLDQNDAKNVESMTYYVIPEFQSADKSYFIIAESNLKLLENLNEENLHEQIKNTPAMETRIPRWVPILVVEVDCTDCSTNGGSSSYGKWIVCDRCKGEGYIITTQDRRRLLTSTDRLEKRFERLLR